MHSVSVGDHPVDLRAPASAGVRKVVVAAIAVFAVIAVVAIVDMADMIAVVAVIAVKAVVAAVIVLTEVVRPGSKTFLVGAGAVLSYEGCRQVPQRLTSLP
jgi:hypothetical protein